MAQDERSPAMPSRDEQTAYKLHLFHAAQDYAASWCLDIDQIAANQWQAGPADKAALVRRDFAGLPLASLNRLLALLFDEIERTMPTAAELRAMCNPVIDPDDPLNDVNVPF
jgi:delta 1-pyrroline-5-carboxylate dehydrogenase